MNIFVISDTHFHHSNILNFKDEFGNRIRPFSSVEEMNETMVENWNSIVRPSDHVWHLGDVYFGKPEDADKILSQLNGKKRLLLGNHDHGKDMVLQKHFQKIEMWRIFPERKTVLTHVPVFLGEEKHRKYDFNIHGHVHSNSLASKKYLNVSVEVTGYKPVAIEDAFKKLGV